MVRGCHTPPKLSSWLLSTEQEPAVGSCVHKVREAFVIPEVIFNQYPHEIE